MKYIVGQVISFVEAINNKDPPTTFISLLDTIFNKPNLIHPGSGALLLYALPQIMPSGLWLLLITTYTIINTHSLLQPQQVQTNRGSTSRTHAPSRPPTSLSVFFANENDKTVSQKNNISQKSIDSNADLLQTLQLKDEALGQAKKAVSSLETALDSAVSNLETMQQQLQRQVKELEGELKTTKGELVSSRAELKNVQFELSNAKDELQNVNNERDRLQWALGQSRDEARKSEERVQQLEAYLAGMGVDASSVQEKKVEVRVDVCSIYYI